MQSEGKHTCRSSGFECTECEVTRLRETNVMMLEALQMVAGLLDNFPGFDSRAVPFVNRPVGNIGYEVRAAIRAATGEE